MPTPTLMHCLITAPGTNKVHIGWSRDNSSTCRVLTGTFVATLPEDAHDGAAPALLEAGIAPSRLCGSCFFPEFRADYKAAWAKRS